MPTATPTADIVHNAAAVVNPCILFSWKMISPAPINPIPITICAIMRAGSGKFGSKESTVNNAAPIVTNEYVFVPASFPTNSRSMPTERPSANAINKGTASDI